MLCKYLTTFQEFSRPNTDESAEILLDLANRSKRYQDSLLMGKADWALKSLSRSQRKNWNSSYQNSVNNLTDRLIAAAQGRHVRISSASGTMFLGYDKDRYGLYAPAEVQVPKDLEPCEYKPVWRPKMSWQSFVEENPYIFKELIRQPIVPNPKFMHDPNRVLEVLWGFLVKVAPGRYRLDLFTQVPFLTEDPVPYSMQFGIQETGRAYYRYERVTNGQMMMAMASFLNGAKPRKAFRIFGRPPSYFMKYTMDRLEPDTIMTVPKGATVVADYTYRVYSDHLSHLQAARIVQRTASGKSSYLSMDLIGYQSEYLPQVYSGSLLNLEKSVRNSDARRELGWKNIHSALALSNRKDLITADYQYDILTKNIKNKEALQELTQELETALLMKALQA